MTVNSYKSNSNPEYNNANKVSPRSGKIYTCYTTSTHGIQFSILDFSSPNSPSDLTLNPGESNVKYCLSVTFNFMGTITDEDPVYYAVLNFKKYLTLYTVSFSASPNWIKKTQIMLPDTNPLEFSNIFHNRFIFLPKAYLWSHFMNELSCFRNFAVTGA
jgi:hypothetical protein